MNDNKKGGPMIKMPPGIMGYLAVAIVVWIVINTVLSFFTSGGATEEIKYNEFLKMLRDGKVAEVTIKADRLEIIPVTETDAEPTPAAGEGALSNIFSMNGAQNASAQIQYFTGNVYDPDLIALLNEHHVIYDTPVNTRNPILDFFMQWILPILVIYGLSMLLLNSLSKRMGGGKGGFMSFGQSNARVYVEKKTGIVFDDVAGQEEAKESLMEIVDFLHNPEKYLEIGAKQPKGALLVGPPGTGKTLLAKAVAGEANVAFFSMTGSAFDEMFVGVGASRVRDLFKQANQMAPCIIFIDEIDAMGRSRDGHNNSSDGQTLNQLLSEMDGFDPSKGVVILAATNRPEILDRALLRPGRFDRRIIVERPDLKGREDILKVHIKKVKTSRDVDLKKVALSTSGAAGADLANIVNEAALRAVRLQRREVNQEDLMESVEVIEAGKEKKDRIMTEKEKRIVAFHEVGHALVAARQKNTQPVQKITIVPRTMGALGYVIQMPEEEHFIMTKEEILAQITISMAGRAAEEAIFHLQTTGAANDIEQATKMARNMISLYGMSESFGMMGLWTIESQYLEGRAVSLISNITEAQADKEVKQIIGKCYQKAMDILETEHTVLTEIAEFLIEKETITGDEFMEILNKYPAVAGPVSE